MSGKQSVVAYRLTRAKAQERIRALALETGNIFWGEHALQRMEEREILDIDVLRILRNGMCNGEPLKTSREDEWKCKMILRLRGAREAGVVVIIIRRARLFVKTVEWEDFR